jgi:DNA-binding transcriptional ArsR family regulator
MKNLDIDSAVAVARALGHPARLRTVAMLRSGELCPCQITEVLGLASSTVSAHLKELKQAGLTVERKDGRWVYIGLAGSTITKAWIDTSLAPLSGDPQLAEDQRRIVELRELPVEDLCRLGYEKAKAKFAESKKQMKGTE